MNTERCTYCLELFDPLLNPEFSIVCQHKICNECRELIIRKNKKLCPIHHMEIVSQKLNLYARCKVDKKNIVGCCYDHAVYMCGACGSKHKDCKNKVNCHFDAIPEKLKNECQKLYSPWSQNKILNEDFNILNSGLEDSEKDIALYEFYIKELTQAKKSRSSEKKVKVLNMCQDISDKTLTSIKKHSELYEKMTQKPRPDPASEVPVNQNFTNSIESNDQDLNQFEGGDGQEQNFQGHPPIMELYQKLGKKVLRLFYGQTISTKEDDNMSFFVSQDLAESLIITGFAIGTSVACEFIEITNFEMGYDNDFTSFSDKIIFNEDNTFYQEVSLDKHLRLERNVGCFVNICLQGIAINYFTHPIPGPVNIVSADMQPLVAGCPILYFMLRDPLD